jgi:hypothetical protein
MGRRNAISPTAQSPVRCRLFNMKFFLLFVFSYFLTLKSFSQEPGYFRSPYQLIITGRSFNLEHYAMGDAHGEWADSSKLKLRTNHCVENNFCLIDSIEPSDLDSILSCKIQVHKNDLKLSVYRITLKVIEPDGTQFSLISNRLCCDA